MDSTSAPLEGEGPHNGGDTFINASYHFMTFLYAAAVHLVIHNAHEFVTHVTPYLVVVLGLIVFLFSDWASRTRLPRLLPEHFPGPIAFVKTFLEIVCVFFLVAAFLAAVSSDTSDKAHGEQTSAALAFGVFLVATYLWDLLLIFIMKSLDLGELALAVLWGNARYLKASEEYLGRFNEWKVAQRKAITDEFRANFLDAPDPNTFSPRLAKEVAKRTKNAAKRAENGDRRLRLLEGVAATLVQFVAIHLLLSNLFAGIVLIITGLHGGPLLGGASPFYSSEGSSYADFGHAASLSVLGIATLLLSFLFRHRIVWVTCGLVLLGLAGCWLAKLHSDVIGALAILSGAALVSTIMYARATSSLDGETPAPIRKNRDAGAGIVMLVAVVLLYLALTPTALMVLMAAQQMCVNAFLQFAVRYSPTAELPGNPESVPTLVRA